MAAGRKGKQGDDPGALPDGTLSDAGTRQRSVRTELLEPFRALRDLDKEVFTQLLASQRRRRGAWKWTRHAKPTRGPITHSHTHTPPPSFSPIGATSG